MLDFLFRKNIVKSGVLSGMCDVHSHLLPAVDDGIPSLEAAREALRFFEQLGVRKMILTPHIMEDLSNNRASVLKEKFDRFVCQTESQIRFRLAGEYMMDAAFQDRMQEEILSLGKGHVLVETSYMSGPPNLEELLYQITVSGYTPVIAHPERYVYLSDSEIGSLRDSGCELQMNLMSLAGIYGKGIGRRAETFLKAGWYTYIGSDFHRLSVYQRALSQINLTSSQQQAIRRLLENNDNLWE